MFSSYVTVVRRVPCRVACGQVSPVRRAHVKYVCVVSQLKQMAAVRYEYHCGLPLRIPMVEVLRGLLSLKHNPFKTQGAHVYTRMCTFTSAHISVHVSAHIFVHVSVHATCLCSAVQRTPHGGLLKGTLCQVISHTRGGCAR